MTSAEFTPTSAEVLESEVEDEVDQLESDSEIDGLERNSTVRKNEYEEPRIPGLSLLPAVRLENILKAEGVTGNLSLSKEGLFILSMATEEFIKKMAAAGHLKATSERRSTVTYSDMSTLIEQYQEFMFLGDTIPAPIFISEALSLREEREKELLDDDPALSTLTSTSKPLGKTGARPQGHNSRGWAMINGHPRKNGSSSSSSKKEKKTEKDDHHKGDDRHSGISDANKLWIEGSVARAAASECHRSVQNGNPAHTPTMGLFSNGHNSSPLRSGALPPRSTRNELAEHATPSVPFVPPSPTRLPHFVAPEENWAPQPQYAGQTTGFLTGPGGPFNHVNQNPGRTIYSKNRNLEN